MVRSRDVNLFYDPVTGYNKDPIVYGRPNPAWGLDQWLTSDGKTESRLLSSSFTRRFNNSFQASSTYTLALSMKDDTTGFGYQANNPFDQDADWATSSGFQTPHVPHQRDRQAAVGILGLGLLLLRVGRALQPDELDAARTASRARTGSTSARPSPFQPPCSIAGTDRRSSPPAPRGRATA